MANLLAALVVVAAGILHHYHVRSDDDFSRDVVFRTRRQLFGHFNPQQVVVMLENHDYVKNQVACIVMDDFGAAVLCDRMGRLLRKNIPIALRTAKCPGKCSPKDRKLILQAMETMQKKHTIFWNLLLEHFTITPEQVAQLEKWADEVRKEAPIV